MCIQELDEIIGTLVKLKKNVIYYGVGPFPTLYTASIRLGIESYIFLTSSR